MKKLLTILFASLLCLSFLAGCSTPNPNPTGTQDQVRTYTIGVYMADQDIWDSVNARLAEHNIELKFEYITDYQTANILLHDGDLDLNAFQTLSFLNTSNANHNHDLQVLSYTYLAPLAVYSTKIADMAELPDGAIISIPNDGSNRGRALLLLQDLGLITVDPAAGAQADLTHITSNPKNYDIQELSAEMLPRTLDDVDISVINNNFAADAGLSVGDDAIAHEDPAGEGIEQYWNVIAVRADDKDKADYVTIATVFRTQATADAIRAVRGGNNLIPVFEID